MGESRSPAGRLAGLQRPPRRLRPMWRRHQFQARSRERRPHTLPRLRRRTLLLLAEWRKLATLKILTLLCFSMLFVFSANPQASYAPDSKQVEDVHEAVLRHFFAHELSASNAEAFCISSARSLPLNFVKRFANNDPPVVWLSECPFGSNKE